MNVWRGIASLMTVYWRLMGPSKLKVVMDFAGGDEAVLAICALIARKAVVRDSLIRAYLEYKKVPV